MTKIFFFAEHDGKPHVTLRILAGAHDGMSGCARCPADGRGEDPDAGGHVKPGRPPLHRQHQRLQEHRQTRGHQGTLER